MTWGGKRPGSGRKKGSKNSKKEIARNKIRRGLEKMGHDDPPKQTQENSDTSEENTVTKITDTITKPEGKYNSALEYLQAVVSGTTPADGLRISAARAILPYEAPQARAKKKAPTPRILRKKEGFSKEKANLLKFEEKAAKIRAKYAKKGKK